MGEWTVIKVLLVDDERYMIEMLKEIIDWEFYGFSIVRTTGECQRRHEFVLGAARYHYHGYLYGSDIGD